jgi:hypothetical protein
MSACIRSSGSAPIQITAATFSRAEPALVTEQSS